MPRTKQPHTIGGALASITSRPAFIRSLSVPMRIKAMRIMELCEPYIDEPVDSPVYDDICAEVHAKWREYIALQDYFRTASDAVRQDLMAECSITVVTAAPTYLDLVGEE